MPTVYFIAFIFLAAGIHLTVQSSDSWGYSEENGPTTWPDLCQVGKRQSPIDITTENTIRSDLGSLKFIRYDFAYSGILTNTGHNVQIVLSGVPVHLAGGGLSSTFVLEQLHFHWNAEHTIDGIRDALELHLVHYDKKYGNVSNASHHKNGICVVAVLFKLSDDDNDDLYAILKAAETVSQWVGKSGVEMQRKVVPMLLLPKDRTTYYRYDGSLTTPGCQEAVTWFVMTEKLTVSESQVNILRNVKTSNGSLEQNYRPTQNLYNRKIYHHMLGYSSDASRCALEKLIYIPVILSVIRQLSHCSFMLFN